MFSRALTRLRSVGGGGWPVWAIVPLAVVAMFALGGDRSHIYRSGIHNYNTAKTLAIAENLSISHRLRLIHRMTLHEGGEIRYTLYARFPITAYALVKAAIAPFGDDLSAKIVAARALMLALFAAAALLAYFALVRVCGSRLIALAAVSLSFSGYYMLYYSDAVVNEGTMDLFGVMLTFHGMVVFVQEGRFRQLLIKTCAALLFGWHVYALLLPFIALGLGGEAWALARRWFAARRRPREGESPPAASVRAALGSLVRSRFVALAAVSILFGSAFLAFNTFNEYDTLKDSRAASDMSLFRAITRRILGQDATFNEKYADALAWDNFAARQFMRVGGVSLPYALARGVDGFDFPETREISPAPVAVGVLASFGALGGVALVARRRSLAASVRICALPLASVVLLGFCWALIARFNTADHEHEFESVFYIGIPLTLFALALSGARALWGRRIGGVLAAVACAAALSLAASVFYVGKMERDSVLTEFRKNLTAQMTEARPMTRGKAVTLSSDIEKYHRYTRYFEFYYYLAGSFVHYDDDSPTNPFVPNDFLISRYRAESLNPLTPESAALTIYGPTNRIDLYRAETRRLAASEPAARGVFDVYKEGRTLTYVKRQCSPADAERTFFLHVFPADPGVLSARQRQGGFDGLNFALADKGEVFDGACMTVEDLPTYPIARFRTGQYISGVGEIWSVEATTTPDAEALALYEAAYQSAASTQPAARSVWDVYMEGKTLTYLKSPCAEDDTRGRFLLSVYPQNLADIPEERRALGHESLNFDFERWGIMFGGKCMARRALPDYDVDKIRTGQWIPGGESLWTAEFAVGD